MDLSRQAKFARKVTEAIVKGVIVQGFENDADAAGVVEGQRLSIQRLLVDAITGYEAELLAAASTENIQRRCGELRIESLKMAYTADLLEALMASRQDAWDALKKEAANGEEAQKG